MNIIVAFAKAEDAHKFKSILLRGGFDNITAVTSGMQALSAMEDLGSGVIVCGYRLSDMLYSDLVEDLPGYFQMLMIASADKSPAGNDNSRLIYLPTPVTKESLYSTLSMMMEGVSRARQKAKQHRLSRSDADKQVIKKAKEILMDKHHMTEPEAHKYLQKCSMESGCNMVETAEMVLSLGNM